MAIKTRSAFTYGHTIDDNNQYINFSEDGIIELSATIETGSYYLNDFINQIAIALNDIGDNNYVVSVDRLTRKITISGDNNFDLLVTNGQQLSISAFPLMGFTTDRTGSNSYEADIASGFIYYPQAPLRDYMPFDNVFSRISGYTLYMTILSVGRQIDGRVFCFVCPVFSHQ